MSHRKHEEWRRRFWKAMAREAIWESGPAPGIPEILRTDAKIWHLLDEKCFDGVQIINTKKPLEESLPSILQSYEIDSLLAVRPRGRTTETKESGKRNPRGQTKNPSETDTKINRKVDNQERQIANLKRKLDGSSLWQGAKRPRTDKGSSKGRGRNDPKGKGKGKGTKGKGKGKGKAKGKGKKGKFDKAMPAPLIGGRSQDDNGKDFCYGFNMGGCKSKIAAGGTCDRGLHKCMKKGCNGDHAFVNCTA
jgi:hypothetical protein